jgi:PKHD-type hydroxylase
MFLIVNNVLTSEELENLVIKLEKANFVDGKVTAGWSSKLVKNNNQLDFEDVHAEELEEIVIQALKRNLIFQAAVLPKIIHTIVFSRYEKNMYYGSHVDNVFMGGENFFRADVSFTIFLSDPTTYSGGELITEGTCEDRTYKLPAGSAVIYPSLTLHRVAPVTEGTRLVAVGWIQSLVRDPQQRAILFDLDAVRRSIFAKDQKSVEYDILWKTHTNLLRQWAE